MHANEQRDAPRDHGDARHAPTESCAVTVLEKPVARHVHRDRQFGIGYGNSSGYGSTLHFIDARADAPFRFR